MCGIAGLLNKHGIGLSDPDIINGMTENLRHRGPDSSGFHIEGCIAMGFRRLEVIDITGSNQPMPNEDKTIWLLFNGVIYNHNELREKLKAKGHQFRTIGDTETIVHAYEEYNLDFVQHLRGSFAIAIWDSIKKKLILVRDRFGKKPLFYSESMHEIVFASETKAFLSWPSFNKTIDMNSVNDYLRFSYLPGRKSIYSNVKKVQPASMVIYDVNTKTFAEIRYWDMQFNSIYRPKDELIMELESKLVESIKLRFISDAPVGLFLSGGLDSSTIAALSTKIDLKSPLKTFTVGLPDSRYDERIRAGRYATLLGTDHTEILIPKISESDLYDIAWYLDEPFADSGSLPVYFGCKFARQHIKVAITGDGGDELFAGYSYFKKLRTISLIERLPKSVRNGFYEFIMNFGAGILGDLKTSYILKALNAANLKPQSRFLYLSERFKGNHISQLLSKDNRESINSYDFEEEWEDLLKPTGNYDKINYNIYLTTKLNLPNDYLTKWDRMSMSQGIETRSPMLDHKLAEYCFTIPGSMKLRGANSKYILKQMVNNIFPKDLVSSPKKGFGHPLGFLFDSSMDNLISDCLSEESIKKRGILDHKAVCYLKDGLMKNKFSDISQWQRVNWLWTLLMLELWCRRFLD